MPPHATRDRILHAAIELLTEGGRDAVSTRSVSAAAGVQPPTIYRLFGDMDGLLDAVASAAFEDYLKDKRRLGETGDPVDDLRRSWDLHVEFGVTHPAFYTLVYGADANGKAPKLRQEALDRLLQMMSRVAAAGRLRMSVERAAALMHANGVGVVLYQIALPAADRDEELSVIAREGVIRNITVDAPEPATTAGLAGQAIALRVAVRDEKPSALSKAERALLTEWLTRLANETSG
jgi:AcrR family transcriptional regulator